MCYSIRYNLKMDGKRIRRLRDRLSLTQAQLGQLVDAHWVTVSRWEKGSLVPSPFQVALLQQFETAARKQDFDHTVKNILVGAGIAAALLLLLQAANPK